MVDFMRMKYENPKLKQSEIANQLGLSSSTLQRYRNDLNMISLDRNKPNNTNTRTKKASNTNSDNKSHREPDAKRPQMTSNDFKTTQTNPKSNKKNKNLVKAGSVHENIEINEHYLDETLQNNISQMELAMQFISNDKAVRSDTVPDLKDFNAQSLSQAKRGEQLVSMTPVVRKAFNLLGDDIVELSTNNDALKNKIGNYDEKWLEESKARLLQQIDDKKEQN